MRHTRRIAAIWLVVSIIVELLIAIAPIPSPTGSPEAMGEHQTLYMLLYVGAPVCVFIWVLLLYSIIFFRRRRGRDEERAMSARGSPRDSTPILLLWAGTSFIVVIFFAGWGTFTLHEITSPPHRSFGASQSASQRKSRSTPAADPIIIQAIGRQWLWTFRYPSYGGMVTRDLVVPYNTPIQFHITSLDVVHSLWIYDYNIKADAVPGSDNTAWFLARKYGKFSPGGTNWVKCNELCGIGHSYMETGLYVRRLSDFVKWARAQERFEQSIRLLKLLPKYATVYYPASNSIWPLPPKDRSPRDARRAADRLRRAPLPH